MSDSASMFLSDGSGNSSLFFSLPSIALVAPLLTALLAVVSMLIAAYFIFAWRKDKSVWIRLLGSLIVLCLALAANNWFVYLFAIIVIATLITELEFLERVIALFWGRDKYWDWKMQSQSASEVKKKVSGEVQEELDAASKESEGGSELTSFRTADPVSEALAFEKAVQFAIVSGNSPFKAHKVTTNRKVVSSEGEKAEIDAIVVTKDANFVVEIRYSIRPSVIPNLIVALRRAVIAYSEYLFRRGITKMIVPVAVVPSRLELPPAYRGVFVLRFDTEAMSFVNTSEFLIAYRRWAESGTVGNKD